MTSSRDEELERLTVELAEAEARTEEAAAVKRTFLLNMSHELRTPLNAIIGYSDILLEEAEDLGDDGDVFVADLEKIRNSGKNLLTLVNDVLDMSKIESGDTELYFEEVEIAELLPDVARSVREQVEQGGNRLTIELEPAVPTMFTDRTRVRQMLIELVTNAAKFTADGCIEIEVKMVGDGPDAQVAMTVRDDGDGIPKSELERIFRRFEQADTSTTREHDGAGLGLALCREFSRSLRGELTVRSEVGEGSEFTLTLPVISPQTRIEAISPMEVLDLWARVEAEVSEAKNLEQAAQVLATALHDHLSESTVLARVFLTVDAAALPGDTRRTVEGLAERLGAADQLQDSTRVLSLVGTSGIQAEWNDRRRSEGHAGIPLISAEFVNDIPMISYLLKDLGVPLDWMEQERSSVLQRTVGQSAGLFYVENAALATDDQDRKIIPAQDFVNDYSVGSVFGISGAYPGDELLVVIAFCTEQFPKAVAERFLPLVSMFKSATAPLVSEGLVFEQ